MSNKTISEIKEATKRFCRTDKAADNLAEYIQTLIAEERIVGAVMGAKFGNAAFRQQNIASPREPINLDRVLESGIKQAKEWAEK